MNSELPIAGPAPVFLLFCVVGALLAGCATRQHRPELLGRSRSNSVKIVVPSRGSEGTGFILDRQHVVTAFHNLGDIIWLPSNRVTWSRPTNDTMVFFLSDAPTRATCITWPTTNDPAPAVFDFAILRLETPLLHEPLAVPLASDDDFPEIGAEIFCSGFPLNATWITTLRGNVSGFRDHVRKTIFLQAPINMGMSGAALLDSRGRIIAIVNAREGGVSEHLAQIGEDIQPGSIQVGVDVSGAIQELISTLNKYISVGIGYSVSIQHLREYMERHPELSVDYGVR